MMKDKLEQLYAQEMDRYDFLKFCGAVFLSVIGVTGLMKAVLHTNLPGVGHAVDHGYGSASYGGGMDLGAARR